MQDQPFDLEPGGVTEALAPATSPELDLSEADLPRPSEPDLSEAEPSEPDPMIPRLDRRRDSLFAWVLGLFAAQLVLDLGVMILEALELLRIQAALADGTDWTPTMGDAQVVLSGLSRLIFLASIVPFLRWLAAIHESVARRAENPDPPTAWKVALEFLIPVVSLFRPPQRVGETLASISLLGGDGRGSGLARAWWGSWIAAGFFHRWVLRYLEDVPTYLEGYPRLFGVSLSNMAFGILSTVVAIAFVRRFQDAARSVGATAVEAPAPF